MRIPREILDGLVEHARAVAPEEACGVLAGTDDGIAKSYPLTNLDHSPEHFSLDPREQLQAVRDARSLGLEIIAVYHSHPATPARMSEEDLRLAVAPDFRYVIVSLAAPDRPDVRAFSVQDGSPVPELVA